ncbi:MAG: NfeD family protein [Deltaproteobacteria bacterium]|nr:NfeD family protein [Deltaproteobacteria bacterium]
MHIEIWWIWIAMAAVLLIAEIFTAGFFLIWFSVGAAGAGILAMLGVGTTAQLIVFILLSGTLFVFGRRFAERVTAQQPPGVGADRFIGLSGYVIEEIDNIAGKGRIMTGRDEWRAISDSGEKISINTTIEIIRVDGTKAVVKPLKKEE